MLVVVALMAIGVAPAGAATCSGWAAMFGSCKPPTTTPPTTAPAPAPAPRPAPAPTPAPAPAPAAFNADAAAARLLELSNAERAKEGLGPLTMRGDVVAIAHDWSLSMAAAGEISHNPNLLTTPTRNALAARMMGENVGVGGNVDQVHNAFMNSPHHKENIMEPAFSVVGYAVVQSSDGMLYMTQDFVQPSGAAPRPAAAPRIVKPSAPRAARAPRPATTRAASPATTAAPTTTPPAPETTTTTVLSEDPPASVLAAAGATHPAPVNPTRPKGNKALGGLALLLLAGASVVVARYSSSRRAEMNAS
jgi:uncharacterized protein YkwD